MPATGSRSRRCRGARPRPLEVLSSAVIPFPSFPAGTARSMPIPCPSTRLHLTVPRGNIAGGWSPSNPVVIPSKSRQLKRITTDGATQPLPRSKPSFGSGSQLKRFCPIGADAGQFKSTTFALHKHLRFRVIDSVLFFSSFSAHANNILIGEIRLNRL